MGNGENSGECPLRQATAEEGLTGERAGVSGEEDRALGGCGITGSKEEIQMDSRREKMLNIPNY